MEKDSQKFKGRFRIASSRLAGFDYGSVGVYFVTICTKNREHYFGKVIDGCIKYSVLGNIASLCWKMIPEYFPFASLGECIVMPNHVHGILIMGNRDAKRDDNRERDHVHGDAMNGVSTFIDAFPIASGGVTRNHNPMLRENISTVTRWYKGRVTYEARKTAPYFSWQSRFHDRIIRSDEELQRISFYIKDNPKTWEIDELFNIFVREGDLMNNSSI